MRCKPGDLCEVVVDDGLNLGRRCVTEELCEECSAENGKPVWIVVALQPMQTREKMSMGPFTLLGVRDVPAGGQLHMMDEWLRPIRDADDTEDSRDIKVPVGLESITTARIQRIADKFN